MSCSSARFFHPGHDLGAGSPLATEGTNYDEPFAKQDIQNLSNATPEETAVGDTESKKMNALQLFSVVFALGIGGGYGTEDAVGAAGPLPSILAFILLPLFWGLPTVLCSTEMATSIPANAGPIMWVNVALPAPVSFVAVMLTFLLVFVTNASPAVLFVDYLLAQWPNLSTLTEVLVKIAVMGLSTILNVVGVQVVGWAAVVVAFFTLSPFLLMSIWGLASPPNSADASVIAADRWAILSTSNPNVNWAVFFSICTWNIAYLEMVGTVAEDVKKPVARTFYRGMLPMIPAYWIAYSLPIAAGVSAAATMKGGINMTAVPPQIYYGNWTAGYWAIVAGEVGGVHFQNYMLAAALVSAFGYILSGQCTTSRALAGMGQMKSFPGPISRFIRVYNDRTNTPVRAILINGSVALILALTLKFRSIVALIQIFYCLRLLIIYIAFLRLRWRWPHLIRPFSLPPKPLESDRGRCTWRFLLVTLIYIIPMIVVLATAVMSMTLKWEIAVATGALLAAVVIFSFLYVNCFRNGEPFEGHIADVIDVRKEIESIGRKEATRRSFDPIQGNSTRQLVGLVENLSPPEDGSEDEGRE